MNALVNLTVNAEFLNALLPMHLLIDMRGVVLNAGPTFIKLHGPAQVMGLDFFDVLSVRKPRLVDTLDGLRAAVGQKLRVHTITGNCLSFQGHVQELPHDQGFLINLALGSRVVTMLQNNDLLAKDFAPTDASIDLLYLLEVQAAVLKASRALNNRLHGANILAEEQATTDSLTGLNNRRALQKFIHTLIENGPAINFAIMMIDLDFFKQVNDELGHAAGDHVLKEVADILLAQTRTSDLVARVGGDEFVIVMSGMTQEDEMLRVANRILTATAEPIRFGNHVCQIGASIGATMVAKGQDVELDHLLRETDRVLYHSKAAGRGQVTIGKL